MSRRASRIHKAVDSVLFDLDDTLIDWSGMEQAWEELNEPLVGNLYEHLAQNGYNLPERAVFFDAFVRRAHEVWDEAKEDLSGPEFREALRRVCVDAGLDLRGDEIDALMEAYGWKPMPGVVPYPDTIFVLQTLREAGYRLGIVTNSFYPMWMRDVELAHYELLDFFDVRITASDAGYIKPHRAIYEQALVLLGTEPERTVFVGDRPQHDILGANEAGLISVLIDPPHLEREKNGIEADYTICTLSELLSILEELEAQA
ncbi:MAG: HAD family hydrolase [Anaerolineae bacterium]|nr:HAD family hydrolase [Anaerolineae bacterium]